MNREFLINIFFLLFINLLIKPFFIFGIDRTVQNLVGTETYGMYFSLLSFTYLLQIVNDFGIQNFNSRNISRHGHLLEKYFPNILVLKGMLGLVYLLLTFIVAMTLYHGEIAYYHLLLMLALNQILTSLIFFLRSNISGLGMYRIDSFISVLDKLLMILICGILLWVEPFRSHFRIEWFILAQTATLLLTAFTAFAIVFRRLRWWHIRINKPFLLFLLKESYPYALVIFLMTLYTRIDSVMLERLLPDGRLQAGIYASAYRLLDSVNMVGYLFATLLLPMFARLLKEGESVKPLLRFSFQLIMAGAVTFSVSVLFFRGEIMALLYDEATVYSGDVLGLLMLSFIAVCGTYIYGTLLTANGSLMQMNRLFVAGIALNVFLNVLLIPHYKAVGTAISTLATQFLMMLAQVLLAKRLLPLDLDRSMLFRLAGFVLALSATSFMLHYRNWGPWYFHFLANLGAGLLLAAVFGFVNIRIMRGLLRS